MEDMEAICRRANVLMKQVKLLIESVVKKFKSCKTTGKTLRPRKISFSAILAELNDIVHVEFMHEDELENKQIRHLVDIFSHRNYPFSWVRAYCEGYWDNLAQYSRMTT